MMRLIFLFAILLGSTSLFGQLTLKLDITVVDMNTKKKEAGVTTTVYEGSKQINSTVTSSNGKVNLTVPVGPVYKIEFKKAGKVTRFFNVDSKGIDPELLPGAEMPLVYTEVSIFDETPGVDFSYVKNTAITNFKFDGKSANLAFDQKMASQMGQKIDQLIAEAQRSSQNNEVQYQAKMKEGEALAAQNKYEDALTKFEQALMFKAADKIAIKRIGDMEKMLTSNQINTLNGSALNEDFDRIVKEAEALKTAKKYQEAIDKFEEALTKKRNDQYCLDEVDRLEKLIKDEKLAAEKEAKYKQAMTLGEQMFKQKSFETALKQYETALSAKPGDAAATAKKSEIEKLMDGQKAEQEKKQKYEQLVADADALYKEENWIDAKAKYEEALKIESASTYVSGRIKEIADKLSAQQKEKEKQQQIEKLLAEGNNLFATAKWSESKLKYDEVLKIDAQNTSAKEQLALIAQKIAAEKENAAKELQFTQLVKDGDALIVTKKFEEAIAKYTAADQIKEDAGVKQKIAAATIELEKSKNAAKTKQMYDDAVKAGTDFLAKSDLENARAKFVEASLLDETQKLPKDKIAEIDAKISENKNKQLQKEQFDELMMQGQAFFDQGDLNGAKTKYEQAKAIDKTSTVPDQKIKEINELLAKKSADEQLKNEIASLVAKADEQFNAKNYEAAIIAYKAVLTKDAKNERAISQIAESDRLLQEKKKAEADELASKQAQEAEAKKQASYSLAIAKGDELKAASKFVEAISAYESAKAFTSDVSNVDAKIAEVKVIQENAAKAKSQQEMLAKYNAALEKAEKLKSEQKYTEAIQAYTEAKTIDATATVPDQKIAEINLLVAELKDKETAAKLKAESIAGLMAQGDALVKEEKFIEAVTKYSELKNIDPANKEVDAKIAKANELQQQLLAKQSQKELEEKYQIAFKKGQELLAAQKYDEAIIAYTEAKSILPAKEEPQKKINEINALKTQLADQKAQEEIMSRYNAAIDKADALLAAKDYQNAISSYETASKIVPAEDYPKKKIASIQELIESEKLAQDRQKVEQNYAVQMEKANADFNAKEYEKALSSYLVAQQIKNTEDVKSKINETKVLIAELEKAKGVEAVEQNYKKQIEVAQASESAKDYETAIAAYQKASSIKPSEAMPKAKVIELTKLQEENKAVAEKQAKYQAVMTAANTAFGKEDFNEAIKRYEEASFIYPNEVEPKEKLALSKEKLKLISSKDEDVQFEKMLVFAQQKIDEKDYQKALELIERAEDNRPNEPRLLELKKKVQGLIAKDSEYKSILASADQLAEAKNFDAAIESYKKAQALKPEDSYASRKIVEMTTLKDEIAKKSNTKEQYDQLIAKAKIQMSAEDFEGAMSTSAEAIALAPLDTRAKDLLKEIEELIAARNAKKNASIADEQYKNILANADQLFAGSKWSEAKIAYERAQSLKPKEEYAKNQIAKCSEEIGKSALNRSKYLAVVATADTDFGMQSYEKAKSGYELALTFDNTQSYPKNQIAEIERMLAKRNSYSKKGDDLGSLGEEIDISLLEGAALLAKAEEYRRTSKGEILKSEKSKVMSRTDSVIVVRDEFVGSNLDVLKETKGILVEDHAAYYDEQFSKDKMIRTMDNDAKNLDVERSEYLYTDNVENKRKFTIVQGLKVEKDKSYIDHNFDLVDSVRYVRQDLENRNISFTGSDYDSIMQTNAFLKNTIALRNQEQLDDFDDHLKVIDLTKQQKTLAVAENDRQIDVHGKKIDFVSDKLSETNEKDMQRGQFFEKDHQTLIDGISAAEAKAIEIENKNYNDVYTKQMKTKGLVTSEQTIAYNSQKEYTENKVLDIDKSRTRLNETSLKAASDEMSDDVQREAARLSLRATEDKNVMTGVAESKKTELKVDNVKEMAKTEKALDQAKNNDKKELIYDVRSELKMLEVSKVKYPAKVANQIGADYPEGVSQEVFKQNGPDGLPNAIITRRIVVVGGYGNVYTRTQKYGQITYSKNGEVCNESIWRNETTDSKLEKHY